MKRRALLFACVLAGSLASTSARAEPEARASRHVLEVDSFMGLDRMIVPKPTHTGELSSHNGGPTLALGATYRTPYFLSPFLELTYLPLYSAEAIVDLGSAGGCAHAVSSVFAYGVVAGATFDVWRLRARAGIGAYDVIVHTAALGETAHAAELDLGYAFSIGGFLLVRDRFRIGLEGRLVAIVDASTTVFSIGATIGFDPIAF